MLRLLVVLLAAATIGAGIWILVGVPNVWPAGAYLAGIGALVFAGSVFERHYRTRADRSKGTWEATGERFVDPASGKLVEVRYNSQTGERDYREV